MVTDGALNPRKLTPLSNANNISFGNISNDNDTNLEYEKFKSGHGKFQKFIIRNKKSISNPIKPCLNKSNLTSFKQRYA